MSTVEKVLAGMFGLILLYIVVSSRGDFNTIITTIGNNVSRTAQALQGR